MSSEGRPGRVVVLGGTGFLGRHICAAFTALGHPVLSVARSTEKISPEIDAVSIDLATASDDDLARLLGEERPWAIVNAAGGLWAASVDEMFDLNVVLVRRLLRAIATLPGRPRFVHLGSAFEYSPTPAGVSVNEQAETMPATPYGRTKLLGSAAVMAAARRGRVDGVVLRLANASGPGAPRESLLGQVTDRLLAALDDPDVVLRLSPLVAYRDTVDVRDVADAVVASVTKPVTGHVINIGRGEAISVRDLVDLLIKASGLVVTVEEREGQRASPRAGIEWQQSDITAARDLLDWTPRRPLEDSLRDLWQAAYTARKG